MNQGSRGIAVPGVLLLVVLSVTGCGGGGGGGGDDPAVTALKLLGFFAAGQTGSSSANGYLGPTPVPFQVGTLPAGGGAATLAPYPVVPPSNIFPLTTPLVNAPVFTAAAAGGRNFFEIPFSTTVRASSVTSVNPQGTNGIILQNAGGVLMPLSLDATGALDPTNAFPATDTAPATLRVYPDADGNLATTSANDLPAGQYNLIIVSDRLLSGDGGPFCVSGDAGSCDQSINPTWSFTIGADATPIAPAATGASFPIQGDPSVAIDTEIEIRMNEAVDFDSLVAGLWTLSQTDAPSGQGTIVRANDPFISQVLPLNQQTPIANIDIQLQAPQDVAIPGFLGYVVYMPNPVLAPNVIRIRFVDAAPTDGQTQTVWGFTQCVLGQAPIIQNYGQPSSIYRLLNAACAPNPNPPPAQALTYFPSQTPLSMPTLKKVSGSLPAFTNAQPLMNCTVTLLSGANQNAIGGGCKDRAGNALAADFVLSYTYAVGDAIANNPVPPDATFVARTASPVGLSVLNGAGITTGPVQGVPGGVPVFAGGVLIGAMHLAANPLSNSAILGTPVDIEVGNWLNFTSGLNNTANPPRNPALAFGQQPGINIPANGPAAESLLGPAYTGVCMAPCPPAQPIGNFLWVIDGDAGGNGRLKVFNSNTFELLSTIAGVSSPRGLGISPDLNYLYVSNFDQGTVQRLFANPATPQFNTVSNTISVGSGPQSISVHPQNVDVIVCNFAGNSISIVNVNTQTERVQLGTGAGPSDAHVTPLMLGQNLTNAFTAFVPCVFGNIVSIYESQSPAVPENGPQGLIKDQVGGFSAPRRGCWNASTFVTWLDPMGCFIPNTTGTSAFEFNLTAFSLSPPPNFPGPAGTRQYQVTKTLAAPFGFQNPGAPSDCAIENMSSLYNFLAVGINNNKALIDPSVGAGVLGAILVSWPSIGTVVAYERMTGAQVGTVNIPGCSFMHTYYDQ